MAVLSLPSSTPNSRHTTATIATVDVLCPGALWGLATVFVSDFFSNPCVAPIAEEAAAASFPMIGAAFWVLRQLEQHDVGHGVGVGVGDEVGTVVGDMLGTAVGFGVGVGDGYGVGLGVGFAVGDRVGLGVDLGVGYRVGGALVGLSVAGGTGSQNSHRVLASVV